MHFISFCWKSNTVYFLDNYLTSVSNSNSGQSSDLVIIGLTQFDNANNITLTVLFTVFVVFFVPFELTFDWVNIADVGYLLSQTGCNWTVGRMIDC